MVERSTAGSCAPRRGRILVVDDEAALCEVICDALADHAVESSTSARAALERIASGARFDLILCDMTMPDMGGAEFHACVARAAPDQLECIVFVTGGAFTAHSREFLASVQNGRLDKPFSLAALLDLVARRLGAEG